VGIPGERSAASTVNPGGSRRDNQKNSYFAYSKHMSYGLSLAANVTWLSVTEKTLMGSLVPADDLATCGQGSESDDAKY
jgi:hypothetical protein